MLIIPPPHPLNDEQKHTSCAESGRRSFADVAMHMRSDAASAPAKAQQQPQFDWSRISPMIVLHAGQFVSESNESAAARWPWAQVLDLAVADALKDGLGPVAFDAREGGGAARLVGGEAGVRGRRPLDAWDGVERLDLKLMTRTGGHGAA